REVAERLRHRGPPGAEGLLEAAALSVPALAEPLPRGLARDAERVADQSPAHFARAQDIDDLLELIPLALQRVFDRLQPLKQAFRRQVLRRDLGYLGRPAGNDFVAESHALVADEDRERAGNQLLHLVLRLGAEGAVERFGASGAACRRIG